MLARVVPVLDVGRGDDRAVGQQFHARIAAVAARIAVQELDAVLPRLALLDVVVGADPRHEVAARWATAAPGRGRRSPAARPCAYTPMWRSPVRPHGVSTGVLQVAPSSRLNIIRLQPLCVFSRMRQHSSPPSGERNTKGSQGFLPSTFATTRGSDQVESAVLGDRSAAPPAARGPRLPARGDTCPRYEPSLSRTMLLKVITQRKVLPSGGISFHVWPPSSLMMLRHGSAEPADPRREDPQPLLALRIDHAVDARAVLVLA